MKHVIKVASLLNLPDTRPLVAMDENGNLGWAAETPGPTPVLTDTIFYYSDDTSSESSDTIITGDSWNQEKELIRVVIGNKATGIGESAFSNAGSTLISITIPNSVTSIGENAFAGCGELPSVTIPSSVTSIGNNAFESCWGISTLTIPSSVTSIGLAAFANCSEIILTFISTTPISLVDEWDNAIDIFDISGSSHYYGEIYVPAGYERTYALHDEGWEILIPYILGYVPNNVTVYIDNVETILNADLTFVKLVDSFIYSSPTYNEEQGESPEDFDVTYTHPVANNYYYTLCEPV